MSKKSSLSNSEIASFCNQVGMLYKAGIPLTESMSVMKSDTLSSEGRKILDEINQNIIQGMNFHEALSASGMFPNYVVNLVSLGEESGNLDDVMESLAEYYEREDEISDGIRTALTYPLIMIAMMVLIIIVLVAKVLPIFKQVFAQLGTQMSPLAEKLVSAGSGLSNSAVIITAIVLGIIIIFIVLFKIPAINQKIRVFLSKFPLTRRFYYNIAAGRFASGMYLAGQSGMDISSTLDMVAQLVENAEMKKKVEAVKRDIFDNRATIPEALGNAKVFSNLYTRMITVGYKSGSDEGVMKHIAEHYEASTEKQLRKILSIIEPTLVIVLSLIVGIILLSVLLPLMGIMSSIG